MNERLTKKIHNIPFFFIIGRARSGTTMLRSMFDAHPNVIIPFESPYIFTLRRKYSKIKFWTEEKLLEFHDELFQTNWKFQAWEIDKKKLKADLLRCKGKNDYMNICKTVHANYISVFDKENIEIIGDKTPKYAVKLDILIKLFPEARFIHIIRDYRDQLYSMLKVNFLESVVPEILYQWKYAAEIAFQMKTKYPGKIFSIRYEDLVNNPARSFSDMCSFLNIEYQESCLEFYKKENEIRQQINLELFDQIQTSLFNPINDSRINTWKGKMNEPVLKMADQIAGKTGLLYHYSRNQVNSKYPFQMQITLRVALIRLYYSYQHVLQRLPRSLRKRIKTIIPSLGVLYYKLFRRDKILFQTGTDKSDQ